MITYTVYMENRIYYIISERNGLDVREELKTICQKKVLTETVDRKRESTIKLRMGREKLVKKNIWIGDNVDLVLMTGNDCL